MNRWHMIVLAELESLDGCGLAGGAQHTGTLPRLQQPQKRSRAATEVAGSRADMSLTSAGQLLDGPLVVLDADGGDEDAVADVGDVGNRGLLLVLLDGAIGPANSRQHLPLPRRPQQRLLDAIVAGVDDLDRN